MLSVKQVFELGLKLALVADPRGKVGVAEYLARTKKEYENLQPKDKAYFDRERLVNPYSDSRIHVDDGKTQVRRVMAGIDIGGDEILLASQLGERGRKVDLVIAHHPLGLGHAALHDVMDMMVELFVQAGMPVHAAEKIMEERIQEVERGVHPANHYRVVDLARLLRVNFLNTHTFTDNLVEKYLTEYLAKKKPRVLGDVLDALGEIPEYQEGRRQGAGPVIFAGNPQHRVGKFLVEMTGGTNPSAKVYKELSNYGVSTIIGMHMKDESRKLANESNLNVVIAGHIASDSLGMNLFLDELEKKGVEIIPCGGLIRVSRVKGRK